MIFNIYDTKTHLILHSNTGTESHQVQWRRI